MIKYIIKNCPAMDDQARCMAGHIITGNYLKECECITTCLLKRIADKCYKATHEDLVITDDYHKTACEVAEIYGRAGFAQEILQLLEIMQLLEIEEVDEM